MNPREEIFAKLSDIVDPHRAAEYLAQKMPGGLGRPKVQAGTPKTSPQVGRSGRRGPATSSALETTPRNTSEAINRSGLGKGLNILDDVYSNNLEAIKGLSRAAGMGREAVSHGARIPGVLGATISGASLAAEVDRLAAGGMPRDEAIALAVGRRIPGVAGGMAGAAAGEAIFPPGGGAIGAIALGGLMDDRFSKSGGDLILKGYKGYKSVVQRDPEGTLRVLRQPIY